MVEFSQSGAKTDGNGLQTEARETKEEFFCYKTGLGRSVFSAFGEESLDLEE
jgi:hypothetical protein